MDAEQIRQRTLLSARELGFQIKPNLPLLDEVDSLRDFGTSVDRLLCLYVVVACSFGFQKDKARTWLLKEDLLRSLTVDEREYIANHPVREPNPERQWGVESLWALAWCLGCHQKLDFSAVVPDEFVSMFPDIRQNAESTSFRNSLQLRSVDDVFAKTDLAYCLHWAIRQEELAGVSSGLKLPRESIIHRRRALEWMIGEEPWDEVIMDT
jgi:hypothetical protein